MTAMHGVLTVARRCARWWVALLLVSLPLAGQMRESAPSVSHPPIRSAARAQTQVPPFAITRGLPIPPEHALPPLEAETVAGLRAEYGPSWVGPHRSLPESHFAGPLASGGAPGATALGEWAEIEDGRSVWMLTIRSPDAQSMRVHFEGFQAEGEVWLHETGTDSPLSWVGPYRGRGPHGDGEFWSDAVFAEAVTVTYFTRQLPDPNAPVPFVIREVSHVIGSVPGKSPTGGPVARRAELPGMEPQRIASCHKDITCYPSWSSRWEFPPIAYLVIEHSSGTLQCTGSVINVTLPDDDFGLLTAAHCVPDATAARDITFYWGYQTNACDGTAPSLADTPRTNGARLITAQQIGWSGDFAFLRLSRIDVLTVTGVTELGWTTSRLVVPGTDVVGISHPGGSPLRVAFGDVTWSVVFRRDPLKFVEVQWGTGTTERGSSGSGLFLGDGQFVGVLSGVSPDHGPCSPNFRVTYHRFSDIYRQIEPHLSREPPAPPTTGVEVTLGKSGDTVTLQGARGGIFTLAGKLFNSGATVHANNGDQYRLSFKDGEWTATYLPNTTLVSLGAGKRSVAFTKTEEGAYFFQGLRVESGATFRSLDGTVYRLTLSPEGEWSATDLEATTPRVQTIIALPVMDKAGWWQQFVFQNSGTSAVEGMLRIYDATGLPWQVSLVGRDQTRPNMPASIRHRISLPPGRAVTYETPRRPGTEPAIRYATFTYERGPCCEEVVSLQTIARYRAETGDSEFAVAHPGARASNGAMLVPFDSGHGASDTYLAVLIPGPDGPPSREDIELVLEARADGGKLLASKTHSIRKRTLGWISLNDTLPETKGRAGIIEIKTSDRSLEPLTATTYTFVKNGAFALTGSGQAR